MRSEVRPEHPVDPEQRDEFGAQRLRGAAGDPGGGGVGARRGRSGASGSILGSSSPLDGRLNAAARLRFAPPHDS